MKKTTSLIILLIGLCISTSVKAQDVEFGIKAGLNVTDMKLSSELFKTTNRAGGFIGPTVKFTLPIVGLGVDVSALYDFRQAKVTDPTSQEETVKQQQIAIPVNFRYSVGLGSMASAFLSAGPQWGINIGEKDFKWSRRSSYSLKKSNFSINAGLGVTFMKHFEVSANYNIAVGKTAEVKALKTIGNAAEQLIGVKTKSRNNSWQVAVAYYF